MKLNLVHANNKPRGDTPSLEGVVATLHAYPRHSTHDTSIPEARFFFAYTDGACESRSRGLGG